MTEPIDLDAMRALLRRREHRGPAHYQGCERDHIDCALARMIEEVEQLREDLRIADVTSGR